MKKIYLALLALTLGVSARADRKIQVQIQVDTPVVAQNIITGSTVIPVYLIKNIGPDTLRSTDTLQLTHSGIPKGYFLPLTASGSVPAGGTVKVSAVNVTALKVAFADIKLFYTASGTLAEVVPPFVNNTKYAWFGQVLGITPRAGTDKIEFVPAGSLDTVHIWLNKGTAISETAFDASFKTYPNPAVNELSFEYNFTSNDKVTATILDVAGRTVMSKQIENSGTGNQKFNLDINAINSGMYFLRLEIGDKSVVSKFNIQK